MQTGEWARGVIRRVGVCPFASGETWSGGGLRAAARPPLERLL